jgi:GDP-L-fucose synthase
MINLNSKIYIAGHTGLVGSAILRRLKAEGYKNLLVSQRLKLNLTNQNSVKNFLRKHKPKFIFIAAAKVGGIYSNQKSPAEFI